MPKDWLTLFLHILVFAIVDYAASLKHLRNFHHKLSPRELHHTFGVDLAEDVPEYELFIPTHHPTSVSGTKRKLRFKAGNEHFELHLEQNTHRLVSPDAISVVRGREAKEIRAEDVKNTKLNSELHDRISKCHYRGTVVSHRNQSAAVSACSSLRGSIIMDDHFLLFHPIPSRFHHSSSVRKTSNNSSVYEFDDSDDESGQLHPSLSQPHVIYKRSASLSPKDGYGHGMDSSLLSLIANIPVQEELRYKVEEEYQEFCDVTESLLYRDIPAFNYTLPDIASKDSLYIFPNTDPLTMEMALFLDSQLWIHFRDEFGDDRAEDELIEFSLALMNNVHILYQQPSIQPNIEIVLVRYELWKTQPSGLESSRHKSGQAQLLLDAFCQFQANSNPGSDDTDPTHWDHAVLLTGYDLYHTTSSVAGVAPVARMCDHQFTCSLVEGRHLGRSFVLAHEMGHNLGMVHDGVQNLCSRSCCLMSAVNGAGKTTWSPCSVRELNAYILALGSPGTPPNCLSDAGRGLRRRNHQRDGRLPGQRFTADQQCSFFWGRDYRQEIPTGRSLSDICHILWCGNSGSTISTAHPALEGTWCGGQRWCAEGTCQGWRPSERPAVVDGGWSAWASSIATLCSQCKVTNGIRLRTQGRFCDNPAPNNGGRYCSGLNVRGLVCDGLNPSCEPFTKQQYGDRLCASFKNDIHHPDRQLSGKSYLHPSSTCKIWCHLQGSDLIRNKAKFPDGTPCDNDKSYCVSGQCMELKCNRRAAVASEIDCPLAQVTSSSSSSLWSLWSEWSPCSVTCGSGQEARTRSCSAFRGCAGEREETRRCYRQECESWSEWSSWNDCSATCGDAVKRRSRTCETGISCSGSSLEQARCFLPSCSNTIPPRSRVVRGGGGEDSRGAQNGWSVWSEWSVCSRTCGGGRKRRTRTCNALSGRTCPGDFTESRDCYTQVCPEWSRWSRWSECTLSCGRGRQQRVRVCINGPGCPGIKQQDQYCNRQVCPSWSGWSLWSLCSATCSGGIKRRNRRCLRSDGLCAGQDQAEESCNSLGCPGWSEWGYWNECSQSCGSGVRLRLRKCNADYCFGDREERESCSTQACVEWSLWSEWSVCSVSCGLGNRRRRRHCPPGNSCFGDSVADEVCDSGSCPNWSEWSVWGDCSSSCGTGSQSRQRVCDPGSGPTLITDAGLSTVNGDTPVCSGRANQLRGCTLSPCQGSFGLDSFTRASWSGWNEWAACSVTCGQGFRERRRECSAQSGCTGIRVQRLVCREAVCNSGVSRVVRDRPNTAEWTEWSEWSTCSVVCDGGTRERRRNCRGFGTCPGSNSVENIPCNTRPCPANENEAWSPWGGWSICSRTCGVDGRQTRVRSCLSRNEWLCRGFTKEDQPCSRRDCDDFQLNPFDRFPVFRKTKEEQKKTTQRNGVNVIPQLPVWSEWSGWSGCSCFSRRRARRRYCRVFDPQILGFCLGKVLDEENCTPTGTCEPIAGGWSGWSGWSECSKDCGHRASRIRYRVCANPFPINRGPNCQGKSFDKKPCASLPQCSGPKIDGRWSDWTHWSDCSSSCDAGHRSRTRHCDSPRASNGGQDCGGPDFDLERCSGHSPACPPSKIVQLAKRRRHRRERKEDGNVWSKWSAWSACTQSCGFAYSSRQRVCQPLVPTIANKDTDNSTSSSFSLLGLNRPCRGLAYMRKMCSQIPKCPEGIDGGWSGWSGWSSCVINCNFGTMQRNRSCTNPGPSSGGFPCYGADQDLKRCTAPSEPCSPTLNNVEMLHQIISKWELYFH